MSKLLSTVTITSVAIASVIGGGIYLTSTQEASDNSAVANNTHTATLASVWDKETEPNHTGIKDLTVYRSPTCGCCGVWLEHAKKHGFEVEDIKTEDMEALKEKHNVPPELASCHTTIVDGYVMEGHIPVDDIKRFMTEKPEGFIGLALPGMPLGSPGMEARDIKQPFQVLAFNQQGETEVFNEYKSY